MAISNLYVKHYQYELTLSAGPGHPPSPAGVVYLYGEARELLAAVAVQQNEDEPKPAEAVDDGVILASIRPAQLSHIIELLRHEKPVILCWDDSTGTLRLTTGSEPVGEAERKRLFSWLYI